MGRLPSCTYNFWGSAMEKADPNLNVSPITLIPLALTQ